MPDQIQITYVKEEVLKASAALNDSVGLLAAQLVVQMLHYELTKKITGIVPKGLFTSSGPLPDRFEELREIQVNLDSCREQLIKTCTEVSLSHPQQSITIDIGYYQPLFGQSLESTDEEESNQEEGSEETYSNSNITIFKEDDKDD